ncbi:hypothetical protein LCGC14_1795160 [marine sediment metagenome]|uniref:DNA-directed DNA polymerase n=1 Tax=marine sediment metagenome TaxID=412755 RepID=A0A0F9GRA0_9ZZZZ
MGHGVEEREHVVYVKLVKGKQGETPEFIYKENKVETKGDYLSGYITGFELSDYMYKEKKWPEYKFKGKVTTNKDALTRLQVKGEPAAEPILAARTSRKLRATFVDAPLDPDGRLRSSLNVAGTVSGRFSSSKFLWGTGNNQQNYPEVVRRMWIPDDGYAAYGLDLSGADLVNIANIANEQWMIKAFGNGDDLHTLAASKISRWVWGKHIEPKDITKEQRKTGKSANFALCYGMGKREAALQWKITEREAGIIVTAYHAVSPNIQNVFWAYVKSALATDGYLENPLGRRRRFFGGKKPPDKLLKDAYNWMGQSPVAGLINHRGLSFVHYNQQWFRYLELLNQIHDEMDFQIPLIRGWLEHADMILRIRDNIQQPLQWKRLEYFVPVTLSIGHNFLEVKNSEINIQNTTAMQLAVVLKEEWNGHHEGN